MKRLIALFSLCIYLSATTKAQTMCTSGSNGYFKVDFEGLARGEIIDANTYSAQGIHFESLSGGNHPLVAFDTENPTAGAINNNDGDPDLGSPNEACGTCSGTQAANGQCGIGAAGAPGGSGPNCIPRGMILVIEESFTDNNNDGHDDVPDDLGGGGSFRIYFDNPTTIGKIGFLDDIDVNVTIKYADNSPDGSFNYTGPGENAYGEWDINTGGSGNQAHNITELIFNLVGSGGIASIETCKSFASVGDFVWHDENANGIQDNGEDGISGATVRLLDENLNLITSTTTDMDGGYLFDDLAPGNYFIEFALPSGYNGLSPKSTGNDDAVDSDANPTTFRSDMITLAALEFNDDIDAGFYQFASISDHVWEDVNANGIQDNGERGVRSVRVTLFDGDGNQIDQTTSDNSGAYGFNNLVPGDYYLTFSNLPGTFEFTQANQGNDDAVDSDANPVSGTTPITTLISDEHDNSWDAGIYRPASLGNFVWDDTDGNGVQDNGEAGVDGMRVTLFDKDGNQVDQTTTMNGGMYAFSDITPGEYYLIFDNLPGTFVFTTPNQGTDVLDSDTDPASGRTGNFTLESGENDDTWDAGIYEPASIGDFVWHDINGDGNQDIEPGINGVTVTLFDSDNNLIDQTVTSNGGMYGFTGLKPDDYYLVFSDLPNGYVFTKQNGGTSSINSDPDPATGQTVLTRLTSGENDPDWDAGIYQPASIGNLVWEDVNGNGIYDNGEQGVNGVRVTLFDHDDNQIDQMSTSNGGLYNFTDLAPDSYYVVFDNLPPGFVFTASNQGSNDAVDSDANAMNGTTATTQLLSGETDLSWDAGIWRPGTIGDVVWDDADGQGDHDVGESGIGGVMVVLRNGANQPLDTQYTMGDGTYLFTDLPEGNYTIVIDPSNFMSGGALFDRQNTYDKDRNTDNESSASLTYGGQSDLEDFGYALSSVLPITLTSFDVSVFKDNMALLTWQTSSEINNELFVLERSMDGSHYIAVGSIQGQGTTNELTAYRFVDPSPVAGVNYYRIRQLDHDGRSSLSQVRQVTFEVTPGLQVYPTVVQHEFDVVTEESIIKLELFGLAGQRIDLMPQILGGTTTIQLGALSPGSYFLHYETQHMTGVKRIFKM